MARKRRFEVGGLNIRVHTDHTPQEYKRFWFSLYENRATSIYGSTVFMIGEARSENDGDPLAPITGYVYKFLNINTDDPWFDISRNKPATDEDVSKVSIPGNLKPNLKFIPYVFLPSTHKLYFVSKASGDSMAPQTAYRFLSKLVLRKAIIEEFGEVDITTLTDQKKVEDFWKWRVIKSLEIFIQRPNALEHEDEADVLERLDQLKAGSVRSEWKKASDATTLEPDERLKKISAVAADNGEVRIAGNNAEGIPDHASSKDFPMHEPGAYSPNLQSPMQALLNLVISRFL